MKWLIFCKKGMTTAYFKLKPQFYKIGYLKDKRGVFLSKTDSKESKEIIELSKPSITLKTYWIKVQ